MVLVLVAFVLMEPVAYLTHRFVMHGRLGHGTAATIRCGCGRWRPTTCIPLVGAAISIVVIALGTAVDSLAALAWVGAGITLYGAGYLFVHDLYIHRRIRVVHVAMGSARAGARGAPDPPSLGGRALRVPVPDRAG